MEQSAHSSIDGDNEDESEMDTEDSSQSADFATSSSQATESESFLVDFSVDNQAQNLDTVEVSFLLVKSRTYIRRLQRFSPLYAAGIRDGDELISIEGVRDLKSINVKLLFNDYRKAGKKVFFDVKQKQKNKRKKSLRKTMKQLNIKQYQKDPEKYKEKGKKRYFEDPNPKMEDSITRYRANPKRKLQRYHEDPQPIIDRASQRYHEDPQPIIDRASQRYHKDPQPIIDRASQRYHEDPQPIIDRASQRYHKDPQPIIDRASQRYHKDPQPIIDRASQRYHKDPQPIIDRASQRYHKDPQPIIDRASQRYHKDPQPIIDRASQRYHKDPQPAIDKSKERYRSDSNIQDYQRQYKKSSYAQNPSPLKKKSRMHYKSKKDMMLQYDKSYRDKNRDILMQKRKQRIVASKNVETEDNQAIHNSQQISKMASLRKLKSSQHKDFKDIMEKRQQAIKNQRQISLNNLLGRAPEEAFNEADFLKIQKAFMKKIGKGIEFVCVSCKKAFYRDQVVIVQAKQLQKREENMSLQLIRLYMSILEANSSDRITFCRQCWDCLKKDNPTIPKECTANGLAVDEIPPELACLNDLSVQLVAQRVCFMKLTLLPAGGQSSVRGGIVNVPTNYHNIMTHLPRTLASGELIAVKYKKKMEYKGHHAFQMISVTDVPKALHWLQLKNPHYKVVEVNEQWVEESIAQDSATASILMETNPTTSVARDYPEHDHIPVVEHDDEAFDPENMAEHNVEDNLLEETFALPLDGLQVGPLDQALEEYNRLDINNVSSSSNIIEIAPGENETPIPIYLDKNAEYLTFPKLFPYGRNGLHEQRSQRLTPLQYIKNRLLHSDGRFARCISYVFWALNVIQYMQLISSINMALCKGTIKNKYGENVTAANVMDETSRKKWIVNDVGYRFMSNTRGSPAYWQKTKYDLLAMVRQLGIPTFFFTMSAADLHWPDVLSSLFRLKHDRIPSNEEIVNLNWRDRAALLREYPVVASRQFQKRLAAFVTVVVKSPTHPLGEVEDYFYRIEFQMRGSPHAHGLLWVKNAPIVGEDSEEDICAFVDLFVCGQLPEEGSKWYDLVKRLQIHKHTKTCQTRTKELYAVLDESGLPLSSEVVKQNRENAFCRFRIPKEPSEKTHLLYDIPDKPNMDNTEGSQEDDMDQSNKHKDLNLQSKKIEIILKREERDGFVNNYNLAALRIWQANMDFQFVTNVYAVIMYICNYITKGESEVTNAFKQIIDETDETETSFQRLKKYGNAFIRHRSMSCQEATHYLLGFPMQMKSRVVKYIPAVFKEERYRMLKKPEDLAKLEPNSEDVFNAGLIEKYVARPHNEKMKNLCLADFVSFFDPSGSRKNTIPEDVTEDTDETDSDVDENIVSELGKDLPRIIQLVEPLNNTVMMKRKRKAVIRYHRYDPKNEAERYYHSIILLFKPFQSEENEMTLGINGFDTYESMFTANKDQIYFKLQEYEGFSKVIADAMKQLDDDQQEIVDQALDDAYAEVQDLNLTTSSQTEEAVLYNYLDPEMREIDVFEGIDDQEPSDTTEKEPFQANNPLKASLQEITNQMTTMQDLFNDDQRQAFEKVKEMVAQYKKSKAEGKPYDGDILFVSGPGGTGKSFLLHAIKDYIHLNLANNVDDLVVSVLAPTGTAAVNVDGDTLHRAFNLPIQQNLKQQSMQMNNRKMEQFRTVYKNLGAILIDEISMVSSKLFSLLSIRLNDIFGARKGDTIFGDIMVICFGDFYQIPPVAATRVFAQPRLDFPRFTLIWNNRTKIVELTKIERQKGDQEYAELLNRLRTGIQTTEDIKTLESRLISNLAISVNDKCLESVTRAFHRNDDVNAYNLSKLAQLKAQGKKSVTLYADDDFQDDKFAFGDLAKLVPTDPNSTGGLLPVIEIATGARIMLKKNISVLDGLANGALGTLCGWLYSDKEQKDIQTLLIEFDTVGDKKVGEIARNTFKGQLPTLAGHVLTPINRTTAKFMSTNNKIPLKRTQFALQLAFGVTIHKCQGATMEKLVLDLKNMTKVHGLAYVGLSRVTSLNGLYLLGLNPDMLSADPKVHYEMRRLRQHSHLVTGELPIIDQHYQTIPHEVEQQCKDRAAHIRSKNTLQKLRHDLSAKATAKNDRLSKELHKVADAGYITRSLPEHMTQDLKSLISNTLTSDKFHAETFAAEMYPTLCIINNQLANWLTGVNDWIQNIHPLHCNNSSQGRILCNDVLQHMYPVMFDILLPISTTGNGNCLYNSMSIALFGDESQNLLLRALILHTMLKHKAFFLALIELGSDQYEPINEPNEVLKAFHVIIKDTQLREEYAEAHQLMAFSILLKRPVYAYCSCYNIYGQFLKPELATSIDKLKMAYRNETEGLPLFLLITHPSVPENRTPMMVYYRMDHYVAMIMKGPTSIENLIKPFKFVWPIDAIAGLPALVG